jgi:haloalkane dehalogenase
MVNQLDDLIKHLYLSTMEHPAWLDRTEWHWPGRKLALPDGQLHIVDEGIGPVVVLSHGTPTWSYDWRHVIRGLAPDHRVVALDHLGFGLSERPASASYTVAAHARRFGEAMAHLVPSGPVSLVVHDFGGPFALDWALEHVERLQHLALVNTWMWSFLDDARMAKRARMVQSGLFRLLYRHVNASLNLIMPSAYGDRRKLTRALHRHYTSVFPDAESRERVLYTLAVELLDASPFYEKLWQRRERHARVPMSILWGVKDTAFEPPVLDKWTATFPHAQVTRFSGAGHWPHEEEPAAFVAALRSSLACAHPL